MRSVPEWVGKDDDARAPKSVRLRVFARHEGRCHLTGRKIRPGDEWDLDHVKALANGGQNRESNLAPAIRAAHRKKTAEDVGEKAKTDRLRAKHLGIWPASSFKLKGRSFQRRGEAGGSH